MDRDKLAKWLLIIVIVSLVLYFGTTKTMSRIHATQTKISAINADRDAAQVRATAGAHARQELNSPGFKASQQELQQAIPPHADLQPMIVAIDHAAAAGGVTVVSGSPSPVQTPTAGATATGQPGGLAPPGSEGLYVWQLDLTVNGADPAAIVNFLHQIHQLPRLAQITFVKIGAASTTASVGTSGTSTTSASLRVLFFATGPEI
jgi:hypothetical protein